MTLPAGWDADLPEIQRQRVLDVEATPVEELRRFPTLHAKGYVRVWLGKSHPHANSGGWQYLHRVVKMRELGRTLEEWEHVHHDGAPKDTEDASSLEVMHAIEHGVYHYGQRVRCECWSAGEVEHEIASRALVDQPYAGEEF